MVVEESKLIIIRGNPELSMVSAFVYTCGTRVWKKIYGLIIMIYLLRRQWN